MLDEKSIYIWEILESPEVIIANLKAGGFTTAVVHHTNVAYWASDAKRITLVQALENAGIKVCGSAAVYGVDPVKEGAIAAQLCETYKLSAFSFDAEGGPNGWDTKPHPDSNAVHLLKAFRSGTKALSAWCYWPLFTSSDGKKLYHDKNVLWAAMDPAYGNADFGMSMAYWSWGDNAAQAVAYLAESMKQWQAITKKPIITIGRAYVGDSGTPNPDAIQAFDSYAKRQGARGVCWWTYAHARRLPGIWPALQALPGFTQSEPPPVLTVPLNIEQRVDRIEAALKREGIEL